VRWIKVAAATTGIGALTLGGAALPAAAVETPEPATSINSGLSKYDLAAAYSGSTVSEVKALEASGSVKISDNGFILHIDSVTSNGAVSALRLPLAPSGAAIPGDVAAGSRPGAPVTIYLDFDGETLENTNWNVEESNPSITVSPAASADAAFIADVWAAVAEDYAPFNVNVTTVDPGADALYKTSTDDNEYGSHVIITDSYTETLASAADSSGVAWGGGTGSDYLTGAFVFTVGAGGGDSTAATAAGIAGTASHEAGHNFGLEHDGIAGSATGPYFYPTEGVWGTLMGTTFQVPVSQWSNGGYAGATNTEDDLAVITDRASATFALVNVTTPDGAVYEGPVCVVGDADVNNLQPGDVLYLPNGENICDNTGATLVLNFTYFDRADFAADQVGNSAAEATALDNSGGTFGTAGVIETRDDVDVFSVITAGGPFTATVDVADFSPNLDTKLTLTDAAGTVIAEDAPETTRVSEELAAGLGATVTAVVEAGIYYLTVDGVGSGDPSAATPDNANGYSDYGSLGNYTVSGAAAELITEPVVIVTPVDGAKVEGGSDIEVSGTVTPNATVTLTVGGVAVATAEADEDGNWSTTVEANRYGNTVIEASQKVGTIPIEGTDTVTVTAPVDAPVIVSPMTGTKTDDNTPTISGTGIPTATVSVVVTNAAGVTTAEAVVGADGKWELTLGELAASVYTVTATQSINGATSPEAKMAFTIVAPAGTGGGGTTPTGTGALATTGAVVDPAPMGLVAVLLLLTGVSAVAFGLRKKLSLKS